MTNEKVNGGFFLSMAWHSLNRKVGGRVSHWCDVSLKEESVKCALPFAWKVRRFLKCTNSTHTNTHAHVCNVKKVFPRSHKSDQASMSLIVPSGHRLCVYFKHSAVFAISAMGVRGGILLRAWILMGFLSEKTGPARITPPLYCDGFSSGWTLVYSKALSYEGGLFLCSQRFFGQWLHKSSSLTCRSAF